MFIKIVDVLIMRLLMECSHGLRKISKLQNIIKNNILRIWEKRQEITEKYPVLV